MTGFYFHLISSHFVFTLVIILRASLKNQTSPIAMADYNVISCKGSFINHVDVKLYKEGERVVTLNIDSRSSQLL